MQEIDFYDYELPEELIAAHPLAARSDSRMLIVDRKTGTISHHAVKELPSFLRANDCLVLNDTKVLPARLFGVRVQTGGKWEGLFLGTDEAHCWKLIGQTRGRLQERETLRIIPASEAGTDNLTESAGSNSSSVQLTLKLVSRDEEGVWRAMPDPQGDPLELLTTFGTMPLPPYIKRSVADPEDWDRYQTTYARHHGAVAAPTAGLHLTHELLGQCAEQGIHQAFVTLHAGIGTFRPVTASRLSEHVMHSEWCALSQETAAQIESAQQAGGRVVAIGTTSVRTLETASQAGRVEPFSGETNLFIRPGYQFQTVDALFTNFHLPKSTLLVLVSTFAGRDLIRKAYQEAIDQRYRFFSYGDAMLIL